jgi:hypothetical protein
LQPQLLKPSQLLQHFCRHLLLLLLLLLLCVSLRLPFLKANYIHQLHQHLRHLLPSLLLRPHFRLLAAYTAYAPLACHPSAASNRPASPGMDTRALLQQPAAHKCCLALHPDLLLLAMMWPASVLLLPLLRHDVLVMLQLKSVLAS